MIPLALSIGVSFGSAVTLCYCIWRSDRREAVIKASRDRWERAYYEECYRHVASLEEQDALHRELETVKRANLRRMEQERAA